MQSIRQERLRQGLKSRDLAQRLAVSPARVSVLERDEERGAVTLNILAKAATALNCRLEYRLVPLSDEPATKPRLKLNTDDDGDYVLQQN